MTEILKNVSEFVAGSGITLQKYRHQMTISRADEPYGQDDTANVLALRLKGKQGVDPTHPYFGAVGDGVTDDTDALSDANDAAEGGVFIAPPGKIFAVSETFYPKTNTLYLGPKGGSYLFGQEHPTAGYGSALKWIGAAGGTMVEFFDVQDTEWNGIDLDGMVAHNGDGDLADTILTGFYIHSDNAPISTRNKIRNCAVFNGGKGIKFGNNSGGVHFQSDMTTISRVLLYWVDEGMYFNSQNGQQGTNISNVNIVYRTHGVNFYNTAGLINFINTFGNGIGATAPTDGCTFYVNFMAGDGINITNHQGETANLGTGWKDLIFAGVSQIHTPINFFGGKINQGIVVNPGASVRLNVYGTTFDTYEQTGITLSGGSIVNCNGAVFVDEDDMVKDVGLNNFITYNQCYTPSVDHYIYEFRSNQAVVFKIPYGGLGTYADNAAAEIAGLANGTLYKTATGQLMIVV